MGTGRELYRSMARATGFIFKIHMAFGLARKDTPHAFCYPVMDGLYVTAPTRHAITTIIKIAFTALARDFIRASGTQNMFMIRAGLAYGPVIHGRDIPDFAMQNIAGAIQSKQTLLLSPAMVAAYRAEAHAPPFGVFVDDTAKFIPCLINSEDRGFESNLHQWWQSSADDIKLAGRLYDAMSFYFTKAEIHSVGIGYPRDRIKAHRDLATEYFGGVHIKMKRHQQKLIRKQQREEEERNRQVRDFELAVTTVMSEHDLDRGTACEIVRGHQDLEAILLKKVRIRYLLERNKHSILEDAQGDGKTYCICLLGQQVRSLQIARCATYEVDVFDPDAVEMRKTIHKVQLKIVCRSSAINDKDVRIKNRSDDQVVSLESMRKVRDRFHISDGQLFELYGNHTPVEIVTVEGDIVRGVIVDFNKYEINMSTARGEFVIVFRHGVAGITESPF